MGNCNQRDRVILFFCILNSVILNTEICILFYKTILTRYFYFSDDLDLESFGKKKKKGKKKPLGMEELEDALPNDDEVSISFSMFGSI